MSTFVYDMAAMILITGSNRGLGRALAEHLASRGRAVLATARDPASLRSLKGVAMTETLDVTNEASVRSLAERLALQGIQLEGLVNNAAIFEREPTPEAARRTIETNVHGVLRTIDALLRLFVPGARIINISSGLGQLRGYTEATARKFRAARSTEDVLSLAHDYLLAAERGELEQMGFRREPYAVSKALLNALTRVLAHDLSQRHIDVVAVGPGWVRTDMGGPSAPRSLAEGVASLAWPFEHPIISGRLYEDGEEVPY